MKVPGYSESRAATAVVLASAFGAAALHDGNAVAAGKQSSALSATVSRNFVLRDSFDTAGEINTERIYNLRDGTAAIQRCKKDKLVTELTDYKYAVPRESIVKQSHAPACRDKAVTNEDITNLPTYTLTGAIVHFNTAPQLPTSKKTANQLARAMSEVVTMEYQGNHRSYNLYGGIFAVQTCKQGDLKTEWYRESYRPYVKVDKNLPACGKTNTLTSDEYAGIPLYHQK